MRYTLSELRIFAVCLIMIACALIIRLSSSHPRAVNVFGSNCINENFQKNITLSDLAENVFCIVTNENDG